MPTSSCRRLFLLQALLLAALPAQTVPAGGADPVYRWSTFLGRSSQGAEDGPVLDARFNQPRGLARDSAGNIYVADTGNHTIRKITPAGLVTTLAGKAGEKGTTDGNGPQARFNAPRDVAVDPAGNVFVTDSGNHTIRMITPGGMVSTLAGGPGQAGHIDGAVAAARFDQPDQIAVDGAGAVYVVNGGLRKIAGGQVTTLLQSVPYTTGGGLLGTLSPTGNLAVTSDGRIYFSASVQIPQVDGTPRYYSSQRVMRLDPAGALTPVASADSSEHLPSLFYDYNRSQVGPMTLDRNGNLYVRVRYNSTYDDYYLLRLAPDGTSTSRNPAFFSSNHVPDDPPDLLADEDGAVYYTRTSDDAIIRLDVGGDRVFAGTARVGPALADGPAPRARFSQIGGLGLDAAGNMAIGDVGWYFAYGDTVSQVALRRYDAATGTVATVHQTRLYADPAAYPSDAGFDALGQPFLLYYYVTSFLNLVTPTGIVALLDPAQMQFFQHVATDSSGALWAADTYGQVYRRLPAGDWTLVAGKKFGAASPVDGQGDQAAFSRIYALSPDRAGNIYVLDEYQSSSPSQNQAYIRKITPAGTVTTLSGNLARFTTTTTGILTDYPHGMCIDSRGNFFLVYRYRHVIYRLKASGEQTVIGGLDNVEGAADGTGDEARFSFPSEIKVDAHDNLYVVDGAGTTIRQGVPGYVPQISTQPISQTVAAGGSVSFSVTASGTPTPTYQWYFNGTPYTGATSNTLSFTNARASDAGAYTVVVTNAVGSITSAPATLTVTAVPPPPSASGGGGGGAPSLWFLAGLVALGRLRHRRRAGGNGGVRPHDCPHS